MRKCVSETGLPRNRRSKACCACAKGEAGPMHTNSGVCREGRRTEKNEVGSLASRRTIDSRASARSQGRGGLGMAHSGQKSR